MANEIKDITVTKTAADIQDTDWFEGQTAAGGTGSSFKIAKSELVQVNADDVPFTPAGNIAATDVQAAIEELDTEKFSITQARATRTVTGADASVQDDDNSLIIFNSATPFDFTLDQITANSKVSFMNIGAGAVTFINGSGVTLSGNAVLSGSVGDSYPSCLVFYHTATTPRVVNGGTNGLALITADTSGGTVTLDFSLEKERLFVGSASFATPKTIALDNEDNALVFSLTVNLTNVAAVLTFPSSFTMPTSDLRWNDGAHTFTIGAGLTGKYVLTAIWDGTDWNMEATNPFA